MPGRWSSSPTSAPTSRSCPCMGRHERRRWRPRQVPVRSARRPKGGPLLRLVAKLPCAPFLPALVSPAAQALTPEELFEKLSPSVFVIHAVDPQGKRVALGSGVVIGREQVITNCHVLRNASAVVISRGNISYGAEAEFPDPERDLCQLKVRELAAPAVALADVAKLRIGQRAYAIGAPGGLELTLSEGIISSLRGGDDEGQARNPN